jgi:hypothetical protein
MDDGVEALVSLSARRAMRLNSLSFDRAPLHVSIDRGRSMDKNVQQIKGYSDLCASAARKAFFQPKDLAWLDSCDKHRMRAGDVRLLQLSLANMRGDGQSVTQ